MYPKNIFFLFLFIERADKILQDKPERNTLYFERCNGFTLK